jgi:hypothetical protein
MPDCSAFGQAGPGMKENQCWNQSGIVTRGPSVVLECYGTRLRCRMPECRWHWHGYHANRHYSSLVVTAVDPCLLFCYQPSKPNICISLSPSPNRCSHFTIGTLWIMEKRVEFLHYLFMYLHKLARYMCHLCICTSL